ncbi:hypothetical protein B0H67DRAFT_262903 [Lasiosphaeris hirsuta]|uniref:Uncharacterized protein n=1 Tax=Lasiosphaeris hirsuta TaxID=260670 RepID=A0AA40A7K2_9PEZI|nr:hypothetical protein B0H67DRAFT_262903 [Lasiosphaeris hirsuta]
MGVLEDFLSNGTKAKFQRRTQLHRTSSAQRRKMGDIFWHRFDYPVGDFEWDFSHGTPRHTSSYDGNTMSPPPLNFNEESELGNEIMSPSPGMASSVMETAISASQISTVRQYEYQGREGDGGPSFCRSVWVGQGVLPALTSENSAPVLSSEAHFHSVLDFDTSSVAFPPNLPSDPDVGHSGTEATIDTNLHPTNAISERHLHVTVGHGVHAAAGGPEPWGSSQCENTSNVCGWGNGLTPASLSTSAFGSASLAGTILFSSTLPSGSPKGRKR